MRFSRKDLFPILKGLEDNWETIRDEYLAVKNNLVDWHDPEINKGGWKAFGIYNYPEGEELPSASLCPFTRNLIKELFPNHGMTGFSILSGGAVVSPHIGLQRDFLRIQLGIIIPEGDCCLRSVNETTKWKEGEAFIFDDRLIHDAWNKTSEDRVILMIDFIPS